MSFTVQGIEERNPFLDLPTPAPAWADCGAAEARRLNDRCSYCRRLRGNWCADQLEECACRVLGSWCECEADKVLASLGHCAWGSATGKAGTVHVYRTPDGESEECCTFR